MNKLYIIKESQKIYLYNCSEKNILRIIESFPNAVIYDISTQIHRIPDMALAEISHLQNGFENNFISLKRN